MKPLIDLVLINFTYWFSFFIREISGNFPQEPPSFFLNKYLVTIFFLNFIYLFIFWVLGAYDRRNKRALLEEFILIFGAISTGIMIIVAILFMGKEWWMSRTIILIFWASSIILLCISRIILSKFKSQAIAIFNPAELKTEIYNKSKCLDLEQFNNLKLNIIIVNYNGLDNLKKCLVSLKEANLKAPHKIIVVDNASSDGSADYISLNYPSVKIIRNKENLGYPRAVNCGIKAETADYYLILNPDIEVLPGSIELMLDLALKNEKAGIIGCKLLSENGELQYSARTFLDLKTYLYRFTPLRGLMAGSMIERNYLMQDFDHGSNREVDWILGGCMLVNQKAIDAVGLTDEKIFLYFEDVDWCFRMWEKEWKVSYVADAAMIHRHIRASANAFFSRSMREHFRSLFYFIGKHGFKVPKGCPSARI